MMPWKTEVQADSTGRWVGNALVFATEDEAVHYVADLRRRWWLVQAVRTVPTENLVNARWDFELEKLTPPV